TKTAFLKRKTKKERSAIYISTLFGFSLTIDDCAKMEKKRQSETACLLPHDEGQERCYHLLCFVGTDAMLFGDLPYLGHMGLGLVLVNSCFNNIDSKHKQASNLVAELMLHKHFREENDDNVQEMPKRPLLNGWQHYRSSGVANEICYKNLRLTAGEKLFFFASTANVHRMTSTTHQG
ncbi:hypothetical protein ACJX0J_036149, partial [Zea mays]